MATTCDPHAPIYARSGQTDDSGRYPPFGNLRRQRVPATGGGFQASPRLSVLAALVRLGIPIAWLVALDS
jgi:hypothetical protein